MIQPGQLRKRVQLETYVGERDAYGQEQEPWQAVGTFWASIEPLSGRELVNAQQIKATASHKITMRWQSSVTPDMRVTYRGRTFNFVSVLDTDERNRRLDIVATEMKVPTP